MALNLDNAKPPKDKVHVNLYIPEDVKVSLENFAVEHNQKFSDVLTALVVQGSRAIDEIKAHYANTNNGAASITTEQAAEIEQLKRTVEEQGTAFEEQRTAFEEQTAALNELIETLKGEKDALSVAHGEKEGALNHLSGNHLNVYFTARQQQVLQKVFEFRRNNEKATKKDEYAETAEQMVYVWVADILKNGDTRKPEGYNYKKIFPDLENRPRPAAAESEATPLVIDEREPGPYDVTVFFTKEQYETIKEIHERKKENDEQEEPITLVDMVFEAVELGLLDDDIQGLIDEDDGDIDITELFKSYPPTFPFIDAPEGGPYKITIPFTKEQYEAIAEICERRKENDQQGEKTNLVHTVFDAIELGLLDDSFQDLIGEDDDIDIEEIFKKYPKTDE